MNAMNIDKNLIAVEVETSLAHYRNNVAAIARLEAQAAEIESEMTAIRFSLGARDVKVQGGQDNGGALTRSADDRQWYVGRAKILRRRNSRLLADIAILQDRDPLAADILLAHYITTGRPTPEATADELGLCRSSYYRGLSRARAELVEIRAAAEATPAPAETGITINNNTCEEGNGND